MTQTWAPCRPKEELTLDIMSSPRAQNKDLDRAQSCCSRNPFPPDQIDTRKPNRGYPKQADNEREGWVHPQGQWSVMNLLLFGSQRKPLLSCLMLPRNPLASGAPVKDPVWKSKVGDQLSTERLRNSLRSHSHSRGF